MSRCQIPYHLPEVLKEIDEGLATATSFLNKLRESETALFGSEGINPGMATMQHAMSLCFDWSRLTTQLPTLADLAAFKVLAGRLSPYLRRTKWPSREDFPDVEHVWPGLDILQIQYVRLPSTSFSSALLVVGERLHSRAH